jgi:ABC-type uncharacterized transport system auxiliary subunit
MGNKKGQAMKKDGIGSLVKICILLLFIFIITGCFSRSKPAYMIERYMFDYTSPAVADLTALTESVKVERFSVNQSFNTQSMIYRPYPFKFMTYNYSRWRVNPGDMVTDYFLRDLRSANVFRAVFSYHDIEKTRFVIEGQVQDFLEAADKNETKAILSVNVSLLDTDKKEITGRVVFQRQYRFQEQIGEHTPEEFAKGMSTNMSRLSEQLIKDIHKAIITVISSVSDGQSGADPGSRAK